MQARAAQGRCYVDSTSCTWLPACVIQSRTQPSRGAGEVTSKVSDMDAYGMLPASDNGTVSVLIGTPFLSSPTFSPVHATRDCSRVAGDDRCQWSPKGTQKCSPDPSNLSLSQTSTCRTDTVHSFPVAPCWLTFRAPASRSLHSEEPELPCKRNQPRPTAGRQRVPRSVRRAG